MFIVHNIFPLMSFLHISLLFLVGVVFPSFVCCIPIFVLCKESTQFQTGGTASEVVSMPLFCFVEVSTEPQAQDISFTSFTISFRHFVHLRIFITYGCSGGRVKSLIAFAGF